MEPAGQPAATLPPRRIGDITATLEECELAEPERAQRDDETADTSVPAALDGAERIDFLRLRGLAAKRIGRMGQQMADITEAVCPALEGHYSDKSRLLYDLSHAELRNADWVVLSACNTGLGAGAEAVSGLCRAFFCAGTRALLVSNWPVHSRAAKELTTEVFRRQAKMALVRGPGYVEPSTGRTLFGYAHPLFWAPFSFVSDGGGGGVTP
jgi:hypothetical protein